MSNSQNNFNPKESELSEVEGQNLPTPTTSQEDDPEVSLDPLKRHAKFSWKSFGGEGFIFSLVFHAILLLVALFLVMRHISNKVEEDPDAFVTGAGGGNNGNEAKIQQHRMKPRNARDMVKSKSRIASKSASSTIALPEMPQMQTSSSFSTGMTAGGDSSGFGGGSGGGIGTGQGIGVGNGRNFVSAFGRSGVGIAGGLKGAYFDLKERRGGGASSMASGSDEAQSKYVKFGRSFVKGWNTSKFESFFKSPETLTTFQVFIPLSSADDAPSAFGHPEKKGSRWYVHYHGTVTPNKSGKIRFLGVGDDIICMKFGKRIVVDGGYDLMSQDAALHKGSDVPEVLGENARRQIPGFKQAFRCGPWINVKAGTKYPVDVLIGETPGGEFFAALLFEVEGKRKGVPDGNPKLLRFGDEELPDAIKQGPWTNAVDMNGGGWIFKAESGRGSGLKF